MLPLHEHEILDSLLQSFLELVDQGFALLQLDRHNKDFAFVRTNLCFAGIFESAGTDLYGKYLSTWEPEWHLRLGDLLSHVLEKGEKAEREIVVPDDRWFQVSCIPLPHDHFGLFFRENTEKVRLRRELSRIKGLFKGLVEDSGALFCEFEAEGILSYVNEAYCDFFGLTEKELLGKDFYRFIPEDQRQAVRDGVGRLSAEVPFHTTEHQVYSADGSLCWQRWTDRVFFNEDGSVRNYCSVGFDITAEKEAEEVRKRQSRHLEALFEQAPMAICFSRDRIVSRGNPAFCDLFGFLPEDILGRDMRDIIFSPGPICEDSEDIVAQMDRGEMVTRDSVFRRGDGREINVRLIGVPYETTDGSRGYFTFFQDLVDTRRLERARLRNRIVVEESPVVIFEAPLGFGATCRFISENVSQFGYRARDVMSGKVSLDMKTDPQDLKRLRREVAEADMEGRQYREYTYRLRTPDGKFRWVNERNHVLNGPGGEPESIIGVLIDETELIQAQQDLQKSNERLARHARDVEQTWEKTLQLLAGLTELRDPYTRGHQYRVADLCRAIGKEMGFEDGPLRELVQAAQIHDIGKIEIPSDYLNRPGRLHPEEFDFIKDHPSKGYDLLSRINVPGFVQEIVYQHHERLDGSGYPRGLKSWDILLSSRILAVADVAEAMLSHRPYRPAFGLEEVMEEISGGAGILYDEDVVAACRTLFLERGYTLPSIDDCQ